jgi:hypothetical protein
MKLKALLANRTTLYVVLAISLASLFGYIVNQRTNALMFFVLTGYLTTFFTKNMAIVMLVPLLLTNFVFSANGLREGLEGQNGKTNGAEGVKQGDVAEGAEEEEEEKVAVVAEEAKVNGAGNGEVAVVAEEAKVNGAAKANGAGNGAVNKKATEGDFKPNAELDVKKTKDMSFSYFEKALDDKSIGKLTKDMDNMVDKHEKLEKMIENMTPLIDKAGGLLDKINGGGMGNLGGMVEKMSGMLGGISA